MIKVYLRFCFCVAVLLSLAMVARAQSVTVKGKVTSSDDGTTMPGVNIIEKGSSNGTVTDANGDYSLTVKEGATLIFSFVGYTAQQVEVGGRSVIDISLQADFTALSEVMVVGYGTVQKKDLTGSVAKIGAEDFNKGIYVTPVQLLQGRVAGVSVVGASGAPGAETSIRIRGVNSIRAGNEPLIVVDGVQIEGGSTKTTITIPGGIGDTPGVDPLSFINPNDIESFDVLKDASASAIYGSRGANGVIMITTKRNSDEPRIDFSASGGVSFLSKKLETMTANQYRNALETENLTIGDYGSSADAFDEIIQTGNIQNYNIGFSTGKDKSNQQVSIGYTKQKGIIKESGLEKFNALLKSNYNFFNDRVKVELLLLGAHVEQESAPIGNNSSTDGSLISQALQWNPTRPLFEDGDFLQPGGVEANPLALLEAYDDRFNMNRIIASVKPTINLAKNLDYSVQFGIDHTNGWREVSLKKFYLINSAPNQGQANYTNMIRTSQQISNTLTWKKDFSDLKLVALLGYEYLRIRVDGKSLSASNFSSDEIDFVKALQNAPAANTGMSSFAPPDNKLQSFFGRADLNYHDKFLLTATLRSDGSSKFGENNRYALFPSVGLGWNMHEFDFMPESINRMKLRLGWGETGNQQFPEGSATDRYVFESGAGSSTLRQVNVGNKNLRWETTRTINIGMDVELFNSRLAATVDVFDKKTSDILFFTATAHPGPANNYWTNLDDSYIKNSGVEITLDGWIIENSKLKWQVGVNATFLKNVYKSENDVTLLTGTISGKGLSGVTTQQITKNQPLYVFKLRDWTGIGEDGFSTYRGFDDVSQSSPKYFSGDPLPDVLLGFSSTLTYGAFDAAINFNGAFGHQIYNNTANAIFIKGNLGTRNTSSDLIGNGEDVANVSAASTRFLEDADFIRLANLSFGYNVKTTGVFKKMRVYLTGQNLAVFTNYSGFDPEVNTDKSNSGIPSYGIEYTPYPRSRTFIAGVTASF